MRLYKDVSDLHLRAVESDQPDMFKKVLDAAIWRADLEFASGTGTGTVIYRSTGTVRPVRFRDIERKSRPQDIVECLVPANSLSLFYGAGGVAKSYLALSVGMAVAGGAGEWLGFALEHGPVVYGDFELDPSEHGWRAHKLYRGQNLSEIPENIFYMELAAMKPRVAFDALYEVCRDVEAKLLIVDSLTVALEGDVEVARDFIGFVNHHIGRLRKIGVATLGLDHQGKLQSGERYQQKTAYGTAFKRHLSRSYAQLEPTDHGEGFLTLILRHQKQNFTSLLDPFGVRVEFGAHKVSITKEELDEAALAGEDTINARERVYKALKSFENEEGTKHDVAEVTGLAEGTAKKEISNLKNETPPRVWDTGRLEGRLAIVTTKKPPEPTGTSTDILRGTGTSTEGESEGTPSPEKGVPPSISTTTQVGTEEKLSEMITDLKHESELGLDIETFPQDETARSLDPRRGQIGAMSIGSADGRAYVIDVKRLEHGALQKALKSMLAGKTLITHNGAGFDMPFLRTALGYEHDGPIYDTMVLDGLLFYATGPLSEDKDGNWRGFLAKDKEKAYTVSLAEVVEKRLEITVDKEERDSDWGGILTPAMVEYAAQDAAVLLPLKEKLLEELEKLGMSRVAELEARFTPSMTWCATNGFALDVEGWKEHTRRAKETMATARARCDELAGDSPEDITEWSWNASNHRKVGRALEALGAKVQKREGTGNYITDEAALGAIKSPKKAKELAQAILEYRSVEKYVTTWGDSWFNEPRVTRAGNPPKGKPDHLMVVKGRVFSKYNQLVVTGRGSSKYPNLQNLPADLREHFIAPPGRMLLVGDYDQVEYVAAAYIAGDEQLLAPLREALSRGEKFDFHAITARMILESIHSRKATDEEVAEFRSKAKTVNFGVLYGMTYKSLAKRLSVTPKTALGYIDALFANASKLKEWSDKQKAKAKLGNNLARTVLGRSRLTDLERRSGEWNANASQMLNHPIQGSCAEGYKIAAAMLYEQRVEFAGNPLLVNMVHDEFVLEVDDGAHKDIELMNSIMVEGMLEALGPRAPISAGVKSVYRWKK